MIVLAIIVLTLSVNLEIHISLHCLNNVLCIIMLLQLRCVLGLEFTSQNSLCNLEFKILARLTDLGMLIHFSVINPAKFLNSPPIHRVELSFFFLIIKIWSALRKIVSFGRVLSLF